jgi:uncharacterized protein with PQ loop repeat
MEQLSHVGTVAGFVLPFFNIPLILRILKRKSSDDLSLIWVSGVWVCIVLMTPAALMSDDLTFKLFGISNVIFFTAVVYFTFKYRSRKK